MVFGNVLECLRLELRGPLVSFAGLDGVNPFEPQLSRTGGLLTGLGERDVCERTEAHVALPAVHDVAVDPTSCDRAVDTTRALQVETAAITMPADRRACDETSGQHGFPPALQSTFPSTRRTRFTAKGYERLRCISREKVPNPSIYFESLRRITKGHAKVLNGEPLR